MDRDRSPIRQSTNTAGVDTSKAEKSSADSVTLDEIVAGLHRLREEAGHISYGELALRIAQQREAAGLSEAAARVPRSSLHAMFTSGRRRMNADLVAEIVLALGHSAESASLWRTRCLRAQQPKRAHRAVMSKPAVAPLQTQGTATPPLAAEEIPRSFTALPAASRTFTPLVTALIIAACVGLNYFGNTLNSKFELPLFLDMIGTATAAIALGPWHGALVGLSSNSLAAIGANPISIAFALVNIAGALVWGYGVRAWRMRYPLWRFVLLNVIAGIVCTLVAVPINVLAFGGVADGHAIVGMVDALLATGKGIWQAVLSVNLTVSIVDKLLAGAAAIGIVHLLDRSRPRAIRN